MCRRVFVWTAFVIAATFTFSFCHPWTSVSGESFCSRDSLNYDIDSQLALQLSKQEYGIGLHTKSLHCCVKHNQSIIWYKDGKVYPWKEEVSSFVVEGKSNNQSITTQNLSREDAGTYSCLVVEHYSPTIRRDIPLKVFDGGYSGMPIHTYTEPRSVPIRIGFPIRLYCEAFVGKIDLPDAQNEIAWYKVDANDSLVSMIHDSRWQIEKLIRDDGLTLGLYLTTERATDADFGEYVCSVSNAADQITRVRTQLFNADVENCCQVAGTSVWMMFYVICISCVIIVAIYALCFKYPYGIRLFMRQYVIRHRYDDSKDHDVFILYQMSEINFVNGVLIPTLNNVHDYTTSSQGFQNILVIDMESQARIAASRCVLLLLSYPNLDHVEETKCFHQNLYAASNLHTKVICILMRDNSVSGKAVDTELKKFAQKYVVLEWSAHKKDWSISWQTLRLHLPVKRTFFSTINSRRYSTVNDKHVDIVYSS